MKLFTAAEAEEGGPRLLTDKDLDLIERALEVLRDGQLTTRRKTAVNNVLAKVKHMRPDMGDVPGEFMLHFVPRDRRRSAASRRRGSPGEQHADPAA